MFRCSGAAHVSFRSMADESGSRRMGIRQSERKAPGNSEQAFNGIQPPLDEVDSVGADQVLGRLVQIIRHLFSKVPVGQLLRCKRHGARMCNCAWFQNKRSEVQGVMTRG